MGRLKLGDTFKFSAIVGGQLPEGGEVTVLIPGCGHAFRIKLEFPVAVGSMVEIEAEIVGVSDRNAAFRCQGRMFTLDLDHVRSESGPGQISRSDGKALTRFQ